MHSITDLLDRIVANATRIAGQLADSAIACSFIVIVTALLSIFCIRSIISGLFAMHRSRSALKQVNKEYSFGQKVILKHAWNDCLHAKRFCRFLIICHHCIVGLLLVELLLALLSNIWPQLMPIIGWFTIVFLVSITIPVCILNFSLDKYPFAKWKNEYTFRKYHNTKDHESLW